VRRCDASLHLLHVLENTAGAEPLEWQLGTRGDLERAIERRAWEELRRRLSAEDHARLRLRLAVESGTPTIEILRYARANDVDLIAMGRDGRGGIKPVLMGSVAEGVMRDAPCAVLSVRHPDDRRVTHHAHSSRVVHVFSH
jgi:nucleotide-binding universal stress UspA family protein